ncbi:hypothetical protein BAE44_0004704 [Dichanthelium oligosanthes]|uniref:Protein XRI1 n=1 Tax=Dichanthelium oligosanthes TaxID=888268 RepID=A0A1E5WA71_9POAL|nr:hypothetical protein BAE44_0004704 [Dichanthelium oligosanthes]
MTSHLTRPRLSPELHCQQHAMALDSYSYDCCVLPPPRDWDWDWDELHTTLGGVAGAGAGGAAVQEAACFFPAATPGLESPASSEASSGYLQDAVAHWRDRCNKRQRTMAETATPPPRRPAADSEDLQCLLESFWDSSAEAAGGGGGGGGDLRHDLNTTIPDPETEICCSFVSGIRSTREKRGVGVLYPFAVVKPLGLDDGRMTTLNDVNQRILKRPARPVRHPVGPFSCGPAVTAHGLGLSGKAVVSLTKIRTGGKGTITIIRTRG